MPTPEGEVQQTILSYLEHKPVYVWRNNTGAVRTRGRMVQFGKKGSSDILGVHRFTGKFVALEIKAPKDAKKTTPEQRDFLTQINACGGLAGVATSTDDVDRILAGEFLLPL